MDLMLNVGYGNLINADRIISIIQADSSPSKRMIAAASESDRCIDATKGRKTQSVIIMDSKHVILSALTPETLGSRLRCDMAGE